VGEFKKTKIKKENSGVLCSRYYKFFYIMIILFLGMSLCSCKSPSNIKNKSPVVAVKTTEVSANKTIIKQTNIKNNATKIVTNSTLPKKYILKTNSTLSKNVTITQNATKIQSQKGSNISINSSKINKSSSLNKAVSIISPSTSHIEPPKLLTDNIKHKLNNVKTCKKQSNKEKLTKETKETQLNINAHKEINRKKTIRSTSNKFRSKIKHIKKELNKKTSKKLVSRRIEKVKSKQHQLMAEIKIEHTNNTKKYRKKTYTNKAKKRHIEKEKVYKKTKERHHKTKKQKNNSSKSKKQVNDKAIIKLAEKVKKDRALNKINNTKEQSKIIRQPKTTVKIQNNTNNGHEYIIGPGDVLDIEVWKEPQLSAKVPVRPDGKITLPLINDIQAAGRTPLELRAAIQKALSKYLENPVVSVSVLGVNKKFFILGKVNAPGEYPLNGPITVLQAIALAKGFADWADTKHIIILRQLHGKQIRLKFNYDAVAQGKNLNENIYLKPGDTIIVP